MRAEVLKDWQAYHSRNVGRKCMTPPAIWCYYCEWVEAEKVKGQQVLGVVALGAGTTATTPAVVLPAAAPPKPTMDATVMAVRTLAMDSRCALIGSVTNLWLDGEPTDGQIVSYFVDNSRTGRALDVWVAPADLGEVVKLLVTLAYGKYGLDDVDGNTRSYYSSKSKKNMDWLYNPYYQLTFGKLPVRFYCKAASVLETIGPAADITANMKYVRNGQLVGLIPAAIPDARDKKIVWLSTCSKQRKEEIRQKKVRLGSGGGQVPTNRIGLSSGPLALVPGWYAVAEEQKQQFEQHQGVVAGWRTYRICDRAGLLMGDTGFYWKSDKLENTGCGAYSTNGLTADAEHMDECMSCGIYVQWLPRRNNSSQHGRMYDVYAQCVAYGNVVMYTDGCRAEKVRLEKLYVVSKAASRNEQQMELLRRVYQVPVVGWPDVPTGFSELFREPTMEEFLGVESLFDDRGK